MQDQTKADESRTRKSEYYNVTSRAARYRGRSFQRQSTQSFSPVPLSLTTHTLARISSDLVAETEVPSRSRNANTSSISRNLDVSRGANDNPQPTSHKTKKSSTSSILLSLADNCKQHQLLGKKYHCKDSFLSPCWNDVPKYCQTSLENLRRLLPKVEKTIYASETLKIEDLQHLCDFYNDVIVGGFCTNALHIFDLGARAMEILPRVFRIVCCLSSESVSKNLISSLSSPCFGGQTDPSFLRTPWFRCCQTITMLLDCVHDAELRLSFIADLIYMIKDLCVLVESNVFGQKEKLQGEFEVDLFGETRKAIGVDIVSNDDLTNESLERHWSVKISGLRPLLTLQAAGYFVLNEFLKKCRSRRLIPPDLQYDFDDTKLILSPDLYYAANRKIPITELLEACRQTLLHWMPSDSEITNLSHLVRTGAAISISYMLSDFSRMGAPNFEVLQQASLLVVESATTLIRLQRQEQYKVSAPLDSFLDVLSCMVHTVSFEVPAYPAEPLNQVFSIYCSTFMILFDSIDQFQDEEDNDNLHSSLFSDSPSLVRLKLSILRGMTRLLAWISNLCEHLREKAVSKLRGQNLELGRIFSLVRRNNIRNLFAILHVPTMSEHSVTCLQYLLFPPLSKSSNPITELNRVCRAALVEEKDCSIHTEIQFNEENDAADHDVSAKPGEKRKHRTSDSGSMAKRQRSSSCEYMESLSELVSLALNCEKSLVATFAEAKSPNLNTLCISDFQVVSSTAMLLFLCPNHVKITCDNLVYFNKVLRTFLHATKHVSNFVFKHVRDNECNETSNWCKLVGIVVANGIRLSETFETMHLTLENKELITSHVYVAKCLLVEQSLITMKLYGPPALPTCFNEAVVSFFIRQRSCQKIWFPSTQRVFDDIEFMILYELGSFKIHWLNPFIALTWIDDRQPSLSQALRALTVLLEQPFIEADDAECLPQKVVKAVTNGLRHSVASPSARILLLHLIEWVVAKSSTEEGQRLTYTRLLSKMNEGFFFRNEALQFVASACFIDSDDHVRTFATRNCHALVASNNWKTLLAWLSTEDEWEHLKLDANGPMLMQVISRFFRSIDIMLHKHCSIPKTQLSYTVSTEDKVDKTPSDTSDMSFDMVPALRASAARFLLALCSASDHTTSCSKLIFENAFLRVVRIWTGVHKFRDSTSVCFTELSRYSYSSDISTVLSEQYKLSFVPVLFRDILIPTSSVLQDDSLTNVYALKATQIERQFRLLSFFIKCIVGRKRNFCRKTNAHDFGVLNIYDVERSLEQYLPFVVSHFVLEKDYDALRLITQFKLEILRQKRKVSKGNQHGPLPGNMKMLCTIQAGSFNKSLPGTLVDDVEKQLRLLCLAPEFTERMLPVFFSQAGGTELLFFIKIVLQDIISLKAIISSREQLVLKAFVLELGIEPDNLSASRGLKMAAIARIHELDNPTSVVAYKAKREIELDIDEEKALSEWISSNFRYLLVNLVQSKWNTKTAKEQIVVLRSLSHILDFLHVEDSPQFLPQIMATVSAAIGAETSSEWDEDRTQLRLLAVNILTKFVKKLPSETIGQNLTNIVVCLFPLVTDGPVSISDRSVDECKRCVVEFLEWMTKGKLGKNLAGFFAEIPFLPPSPVLDSFRTALRIIGVDFDHLSVSSTPSTQLDTTKASTTSEGELAVAETKHDQKTFALRKRLDSIRPLLGNENASIRKAVLAHLCALLRSNRSLFHTLVENESIASMKRYLTVSYDQTAGVSRGSVTLLMETLLWRCATEENQTARILVGSCFGEIGAISPLRLSPLTHRVNPLNASTGGAYRAPWVLSLTQYEILLITNYLPNALKAAATALHQNLIGFTIQELLSIIDTSPYENKEVRGKLKCKQENNTKQPMNAWLVDKLKEANVFDIVEPFWFTEFLGERNFSKTPPFFLSAPTFYFWLSNWCRYMVHRAHERKKTKWSEFFYACRGALRPQAGLGVAEFLLPLLVLDCLCFGSPQDEKILLNEIVGPLTFDVTDNVQMSRTDRQKAVNVLFDVIDLLQLWSETETENRHKTSRRALFTEISNQQGMPLVEDDWPVEESVMRIDDLIKEVPYAFRSKAAANVGMYAYSLRLMEMDSRSLLASDVFDGTSTTTSVQNKSRAAGNYPRQQLSFMKDVFAKLDDYESLIALDEDDFWSNPQTRVQDSIRRNESLGNWEAALNDYDQLTLVGGIEQRQFGYLRCLLELDHLDSVLQQVDGVMKNFDAAGDTAKVDLSRSIPIAVEAAWRLGKWDKIESLIDCSSNKQVQSYGYPDAYQMCLGSIMLHASSRNLSMLHESLRQARSVILDDLSSVSRESYSRAYKHIVKLHAIREIEDVAEFLCSESSESFEQIVGDQNAAWESRLDLVSSNGASDIINTRLALARLANDTVYESLMFLNKGWRARKSGFHFAAAKALAQSESVLSTKPTAKNELLMSSLQYQLAKLRHDRGDSSVALLILERRIRNSEEILDTSGTVSVLGCVEGGRQQANMKAKDVVLRSLLLSTKWMIDGVGTVNEILAQLKNIHNVAPKWEKGHFHYAKYVDSLLRTRIMELEKRSVERFRGSDEDLLRSRVIASDCPCQKYVILAMKHYSHCLSLDMKHLYQALPRLLSLWFEFTSIKVNESNDTLTQADANARSLLPVNQEEANTFMARTFKEIPAQAFYTAMPQLISRLIHEDNETSLVVRGILKRVLVKFAPQAMWALAWVRQSSNAERRQIGNNIFREAEKALSKDANQILCKLLVTSKSLLQYLHDLAKYDVKDKNVSVIQVKAWKGEVDLIHFIPPIQAALSPSLLPGSSFRSKEFFPPHVPRMRIFAPDVQVMSSKARPKKIKVFVVSAATEGRVESNDIGEIHFLVKQEAKGDLRKDARVQDLNNVINRIMLSSSNSKGASKHHRRLHLRTFAVTCLSEETGILEWVPSTDSFRNLISKTYNPQASPFSSRRRGKRITTFSDPQLRDNFENKCQPIYFKSGNLTRAAKVFEELCLKPFPPLFFWWFVQNFRDPHVWYESRINFTLSVAIWSAVGHVIGLGDRHSENILVDTTNAECVHVDFDCIFDKGLHLPKPEVIPFRLTQNMIDAFGPTGTDGIFKENLKTAMETLRHNRDTLLSVLEPFAKDPIIDWKRYRSQQNRASSSSKSSTTQDRQAREVKRSINIIDERLRGIYNICNPNHVRIRRTDGVADQEEEELSHLHPLSVEGQVHKMIAEATSHENLVQLYVGWMPWV